LIFWIHILEGTNGKQRPAIIRKLGFSNFYKSILSHKSLQIAQLAYG
jgi:hypothetical protein